MINTKGYTSLKLDIYNLHLLQNRPHNKCTHVIQYQRDKRVMITKADSYGVDKGGRKRDAIWFRHKTKMIQV